MEKTYYQRNLPHIVPPGGTFFITARLTDTLPLPLLKKWQAEKENARKEVLEKRSIKSENTLRVNLLLSEERKRLLTNIQKRYFKKIDDYLDQAISGPDWLKQVDVGKILQSKFHQYDAVYYSLSAFCIMPNHFHLLIDTAFQLSENAVHPEYKPLSKIMNYIKGGSAYAANQMLNRKGKFWQGESYDHLVRNEKEFHNIVRYIANNPVKAKLAKEWQEWQFTYVHSDLQALL
ncbi:MAG: transposase [Saprospiraceae bacterium]